METKMSTGCWTLFRMEFSKTDRNELSAQILKLLKLVCVVMFNLKL